MILAGRLPPDRAARARARLERAKQAEPPDPEGGPPAVGHQRSHHTHETSAIDIMVVGTPGEDEPTQDGVTPGSA